MGVLALVVLWLDTGLQGVAGPHLGSTPILCRKAGGIADYHAEVERLTRFPGTSPRPYWEGDRGERGIDRVRPLKGSTLPLNHLDGQRARCSRQLLALEGAGTSGGILLGQDFPKQCGVKVGDLVRSRHRGHAEPAGAMTPGWRLRVVGVFALGLYELIAYGFVSLDLAKRLLAKELRTHPTARRRHLRRIRDCRPQ